ncbi:hypothetical protein [Paenarthrobacter sp. 2TAF44]|uniref:hypothetical protein n=1 Tax=Paenarthrobacter sp. 2TAF44 TaxID=3233018 RepID=UPI003F9D70D5
MFWNQRLLASVVTSVLSLCSLALIVVAALQPGAGPLDALWLGFSLMAIYTLVRAWQLGRKQRSPQVLSTKLWKWVVFVAALFGSGIFAAFTIGTPRVFGISGMLLLLIANLIPMLLFESDPRPAQQTDDAKH